MTMFVVELGLIFETHLHQWLFLWVFLKTNGILLNFAVSLGSVFQYVFFIFDVTDAILAGNCRSWIEFLNNDLSLEHS